MKHLIVTIVAAMALAAVAAETPAQSAVATNPKTEQKKPLTPEEKAERHQRWLEKTGGHIIRQGKGKIVIVNCQDMIFDEVIKTQQVNLANLLRVAVVTEKGTWKMGDALPKDATLAIYLVNDAALPTSLIAPESRWALVNCAKLAEKRRFNKIFVRTAVGLIHGSASQQKATLMRPILSMEDVDGIVNEAVPFDVAMMMVKNLRTFGLEQTRPMTYKKACKEGWAPAPTNDIQKAIWNEVNSIPSEPIKIKKQK